MSRAWEGYAKSKGINTGGETSLTKEDIEELQRWMSEHD